MRNEHEYIALGRIRWMLDYMCKPSMLSISTQFNPLQSDTDFTQIFACGFGSMLMREHNGGAIKHMHRRLFVVDMSLEQALKSTQPDGISLGCLVYFGSNDASDVCTRFTLIAIDDLHGTLDRSSMSKQRALVSLVVRMVIIHHTLVCHGVLGGGVCATACLSTLNSSHPMARLLIPFFYGANAAVWAAGQANFGHHRALDLSASITFGSMCTYIQNVIDGPAQQLVDENMPAAPVNPVQSHLKSVYDRMLEVVTEYMDLYHAETDTEFGQFLNVVREALPFLSILSAQDIVTRIMYTASINHTHCGASEHFINPFSGFGTSGFSDGNAQPSLTPALASLNTIRSTVPDPYGGEGGLFMDRRYADLALDARGKRRLESLFDLDIFRTTHVWLQPAFVRTSAAF